MNWQKQGSQPLFPDLIWSRPENKRSAGKLLIIGGQKAQFMNVSACFSAADKAGAGHIRVLMPESLRKLTEHLPGTEFAPANASGSFGKSALGVMYELSEWADHVLLAGDFGKNSQTTTVLDGYLLRCPTPVTINEDALSSIDLDIEQLAKRNITIVLSAKNLQKMPTALNLPRAITSTTNIDELAEIISELTDGKKLKIEAEFQNKIWSSVEGEVVSSDKSIDLSTLSAYAAVWMMQQPTKPLEALATAVYEA